MMKAKPSALWLPSGCPPAAALWQTGSAVLTNTALHFSTSSVTGTTGSASQTTIAVHQFQVLLPRLLLCSNCCSVCLHHPQGPICVEKLFFTNELSSNPLVFFTICWLICIAYLVVIIFCHPLFVDYFLLTIFYWLYFFNYFCIYQGLSKHQEVCFTPVTKVQKMIVVFWDLVGAIKKNPTDH